jgi:hypothetical protein
VRDRDKPSSGPDDLDASDDVDVLKPDLTDGPRASDRVGGFRSFAAVIPELDAAAVVVANRARSVGRLGLRVMGRSHRASRKNTNRLGEVAGSTAAPGARSIGRTSAPRRRSHLPCRHACSPRKRKQGQRRRVRLPFVHSGRLTADLEDARNRRDAAVRERLRCTTTLRLTRRGQQTTAPVRSVRNLRRFRPQERCQQAPGT